MGGELPDDVPYNVARNTDRPDRYDTWEASTITTDTSGLQDLLHEPWPHGVRDEPAYTARNSGHNSQSDLPGVGVSPFEVEYDLNPVVYGPYMNDYNHDAGTSSTHNGQWLLPTTWTSSSLEPDDSHRFGDFQHVPTLERQMSWGLDDVELDGSYPFDIDVDINASESPGVNHGKGRGTEGTALHVLVCHHAGCNATFAGAYRKGNHARHMKSVHGMPRDEQYTCADDHCHQTFKRQDARLKHYRKYHPHLALAAPIRLGTRSGSVNTDVQEDTTQSEVDPRKNSPATELDTPSAQYLSFGQYLVDNDNSSAYTTPSLNPATQDSSSAHHLSCSLCEITFRRPADLRRHMLKHRGAANQQCEVPGCDMSFYRMDKLRDHVRLAHKGNLSTTEEGSLKFEVAEVAKQPSSYPCTHCDALFRRQCDLMDHIHRKHERRYKCASAECTQAFHLRADLQRHARIHTNHFRRSFPCTNVGCSRQFSRKDNLLKHVKHHHGQNSSNNTILPLASHLASEASRTIQYPLDTVMEKGAG